MGKRALWSLLIIGIIAGSLWTFSLTSAQSNLLTNPGLEEPYSGRGRGDFNIPNGWNVWVAQSPRTEVWMNLDPSAFPHRTTPEVREGAVSLNMSKGYGTFTAAVYQQVTASPEENYTASAWAWLHTCGDPGEEPEPCGASDGARGMVRIGIDPNGGTDPNDSDIVWSNWAEPLDAWGQVTTSATATGGTITVFLWAQQSQPRAFNNLYWDEASLTTGGSGGAAAGAATPVPTVPPFVPLVSPQEARDDGSIIHRVGPGDTIDSIAFAYGTTRSSILELNNMGDGRIIQIGQEIIVQPPGSVDVEDDNEPEEVASADQSSEVVAFDDPPADQAVDEPVVINEPPAPPADNRTLGQRWIASLRCTFTFDCGGV